MTPVAAPVRATTPRGNAAWRWVMALGHGAALTSNVMQHFADLLSDALLRVRELMPWDLAARLADAAPPLLLDVREPSEFAQACIPGSINVPRGLLEAACDWDYDDTVPALAGGRDLAIVVVCRSGNRSVLAADLMQRMGFADVLSLKTGVRGWNDFEQPLIDGQGQTVDTDSAEQLLATRLRADQRRPRLAAAGR